MLLAISGESLKPQPGFMPYPLLSLFWQYAVLLSSCKIDYFSSDTELNKIKRRLSDTPAVKSGYLEGGASGRLPRIMDVEAAAQSNRWWGKTPNMWRYSNGKIYNNDDASAKVLLAHLLQRERCEIILRNYKNYVKHLNRVPFFYSVTQSFFYIIIQNKEAFHPKLSYDKKQTTQSTQEQEKMLIFFFCHKVPFLCKLYILTILTTIFMQL